MKVLVKEYMLDMLNSVKMALDQLPNVDCKKNEHVELLGTCQDVLIKIAENLPEENDITEKALVNIDDSCKEMYQLTQIDFKSEEWKEEYDTLKNTVNVVIEKIKEYETEKMKAVFMPVLIENWSSMESLYKAALEDERMDVKVMPIPYSEYGYGGTITDNKWDFEFFKNCVIEENLLDCNTYDLGKEHPEMVFINDPCDGEGDVIRVQPKFFTDEIVGKTEKLVYVAPESSELMHGKIASMPGIKNAWKIVAYDADDKQNMICNGVDKDKIIDLGSARDDIKILPKEKEINVIVELKKTTEDSDILTSIQMMNNILESQGEKKNIKYHWLKDRAFDMEMKRSDGETADKYKKILDEIEGKEINELTKRENYQSVIEEADMYIGQGDSWIARLLVAKEKPVLQRCKNESLEKNFNLADNPLKGFDINFVQKNKDVYCYSPKFNGILKLDLERASVTLEKGNQNFNKSKENLYGKGCVWGNKIIFAPKEAENIIEKDLISNKCKCYGEKGTFKRDDYDVLGIDTFNVLMPQKYNTPIYYINRKTGAINEFSNNYDQVIRDIEYVGENSLFVASTEAEGVLYRSIITNSIVQAYDAKNADFRYGIIGEGKGQIWDVKYDGKFLWCINNEGTKVSLWNRTKNVISKTIEIMDEACGEKKPCDYLYIEGNHRWFLAADRKTVVHMDRKGQKRVAIELDDVVTFNDKVIGFAYRDALYFINDNASLVKIKYINKSGNEELKKENVLVSFDNNSFEKFMYSDETFNTNMIGLNEFVAHGEKMKQLITEDSLPADNHGAKIWSALAKELFSNN